MDRILWMGLRFMGGVLFIDIGLLVISFMVGL